MPFFRKQRPVSDEEVLRPHFDVRFYLAQHPQLAGSGVDPVRHYLEQGVREGSDPAPWFSTNGYLNAYPDVLISDLNPFLHYIQHGREEGRALPWLNGKSGPYQSPPFVPDPILPDSEQMMRFIIWRNGQDPEGLSLDELYSKAENIVSAYLASGEELFPQDDPLSLPLHISAVRPLFDERGYAASHPELAKSDTDLLQHYCSVGWRDLDNPRTGFDTARYWREHLNPAAAVIDPLLHYALFGKRIGLATNHPEPIVVSSDGVALSAQTRVRRACLFAASDPHRLIDQHVVHFIRHMSQFADVFFLADYDLSLSELERLDGLVEGAWGIEHDRGYQGSHAMLLNELVGWDRLEKYDEVILADDTAYLVGDLEPVLSRMDNCVTDWWGLSASYGQPQTRQADAARFGGIIPLAKVRETLLQEFEDEFDFKFAVGSGFAAFRQAVLRDAAFRAHFSETAVWANSRSGQLKHTIKLTQALLQAGYRFDCHVGDLYPLPPTISEYAFDLISDGYPLLDRNLLVKNPYFAPDLHQWKERLAALAPDTDVAMIERHLKRVGGEFDLHIALNTARDAEFNPIKPDLLSPEQMADRDLDEPKRDDWWVFPVCAYDGNLSGNDRAVFEAVRHDPSIRKIVLTRAKPFNLDGANVDVYPLMSREAQEVLLRSRVIFIKHSPSINVVFPLSSERRLFIGLWHGIPFKRIGTASLDTQARLDQLMEEHSKFSCVISSSPTDQLAMLAGFQPLSPDKIWVTGLPRNDFVMRDFDALPPDMQREETALQEQLNGKKLVLFCPTFRNDPQRPGYQFSPEELAELGRWLSANHAILGIREHMADHGQTYSDQMQGDHFLPLPASQFANVEVLYRVSDCLLTDYSSCFFDYMLTGKPAISFAYDLERYRDNERGTFYDLEAVFPGPVCRDFRQLLAALSSVARQGFVHTDPCLNSKRSLFFEYLDDRNSERVVDRVKQMLAAEQT